MILKEQMVQDAATFMNEDEFAEEVTYNGVTVTAVVELGVNMAAGNTFSSEGQSARGELWVAVVDVPSPQTADTVVLADGTRWQVARVLESDAAMHHLELIGRESRWG